MSDGADIIDFAEAAATKGWTAAKVLCAACRWLFVAAYPTGKEQQLECPNCKACRIERVDSEREGVVVVYDAPNSYREESVGEGKLNS